MPAIGARRGLTFHNLRLCARSARCDRAAGLQGNPPGTPLDSATSLLRPRYPGQYPFVSLQQQLTLAAAIKGENKARLCCSLGPGHLGIGWGDCPAGVSPSLGMGSRDARGKPVADQKPALSHLGLVVVSVVVVLPPSRSVSVFVWVSVLPAIPSRWTSFSMTVLPFLSTSLWIVVSR
jgi:hypothetical protein